VAGSTFVELVVTLFLLAAFSGLVFTLFWSTTRANVAHTAVTVSQQARMSVVIDLPRLTEEIHPPYWVDPDKVFENEGTDWKVYYRQGDQANFLILRQKSETRLDLVTPDSTLSIGNLPGLSVDWWKTGGRIIGFTVQWQQGRDVTVFHAAWGSLVL
jgi:hypothetical protein